MARLRRALRTRGSWAVFVDVHQPEGVAGRGRRQAVVQADGGNRNLDRLTDRNSHFAGASLVGGGDRLQPGEAAGASEFAERSLSIGGRAEPHALHAAAAAPAGPRPWPTVLAATRPGGTITFNRGSIGCGS